jgi:hypothetical protein
MSPNQVLVLSTQSSLKDSLDGFLLILEVRYLPKSHLNQSQLVRKLE